jgi:FAD/FMN-containing dehydrogenase
MLNFLSLASPGTKIENTREDNGVARAQVALDTVQDISRFLPEAARLGAAIVPGRMRETPAAFTGKSVAFIDLRNQNSVLEHSKEDQVISVQCGMTLAQLDQLLQRHSQWWPVQSYDKNISIGELINKGEGGCLEHHFGGPRELVLGLTVVLSSGEAIRCGGKVVKNVTGYDLQKLFIGSHGYLGVVAQAHLRLFARPESSLTMSWGAASAGKLLMLANRLIATGVPLSCLELTSNGSKIDAVGDEQPVRLFAQVHGHKIVVDELGGKLDTAASGFIEPGARLDKTQEEFAWQTLSSARAATRLSAVELAMAPGLVPELLSTFAPASGWPAWQYRPSRGRLRFYVSNIDETEVLLSAFEKYATAHGHSSVVAYADDRYEYRVRRLPHEDPYSTALKNSIKERYDPQQCLNPLVLP